MLAAGVATWRLPFKWIAMVAAGSGAVPLLTDCPNAILPSVPVNSKLPSATRVAGETGKRDDAPPSVLLSSSFNMLPSKWSQICIHEESEAFPAHEVDALGERPDWPEGYNKK